jgi:putative transposase
VQRCRNHKVENVMNELPKEQQDQTCKLMRAAFRLSTAEEGEKRLEQIARQLEHNYSSASRSLREGMKEMFTLQRLKIPASLHKCLATTNLIESPHSGIRKRTRNVCRWRDVDMVERWAASAWLLTEKNFRRIDGHKELWTLAALLGREISSSKNQKVA